MVPVRTKEMPWKKNKTGEGDLLGFDYKKYCDFFIPCNVIAMNLLWSFC